jgi:hypothetical protein
MMKDNPKIQVKGLSDKKSKIEELQNKVESGIALEARQSSSMKGNTNAESGNIGENKLYRMVKEVFPDEDVRRETLVIEGRDFKSDVALIFKEEKGGLKGILFELDGYRHHGLSKTGFKRDREKDRLTTLAGFITVRFYASEIINGKNEEENYRYLENLRHRFFNQAIG